jgi:double-stranded uracil-DNA glycosylase
MHRYHDREMPGSVPVAETVRSVLPDVLAPDLEVVFCGTAAGSRSAALRAYYAGRGNQFWDVLYRIGLTPRRLTSQEFRSLLEYKIGLTDLAKRTFGTDASILRASFDVGGTIERLRPLRPHVVAFNGKKAASLWLGQPSDRLAFGGTDDPHGVASHLFVLPSTSGMARRHWDEAPWRALSGLLGRSGATAAKKTWALVSLSARKCVRHCD